MTDTRTFLFSLMALIIGACSAPVEVPGIAPLKDVLPLRLDNDIDTFYVSDLGLYVAVDSLVSDDAEIVLLDSLTFTVRKRTEHAIGSVRVYKNGGHYSVPVLFSNKKHFESCLPDPERTYGQVKIKGVMTNWQEKTMVYDEKRGCWSYTFHVPPGRYQYVYVVDGREMLDPINENTMMGNLGNLNSLFEFKGPDKGEIGALQTTSYTADSVHLSFSGNLPDKVLAFCGNHSVPVNGHEGGMSIPLPRDAKGRKNLRVYASTAGVRTNDLLIPLLDGAVIDNPDRLGRQDWHSQIMYFVFLDRFMNGSRENDAPVVDDRVHPKANFQGGDLQGVIQKLKDGYFRDLGVNLIWLSPITQNPLEAFQEYPEPRRWYTGYHGYWPISSNRVDARFGTAAELRELIDLAHSQGINVFLDYICNHVHKNHKLYQQHPDWATPLYLEDGTANIRIWEEQRLTTWFDDFLPSLDLSNPEVIKVQADSAFYWLHEFGFDGFRHDATKHVPEAFWRHLTQQVSTEITDREVLQIGETYGSRELISSFISTGQIDAQFDFEFYFETRNLLLDDQLPFSDLEKTIDQSLSYFGHQHVMGNITGNHDQPRFISLAGGGLSREENEREAGFQRDVEVGDPKGYAMLRLLQAINFAVPGIPVNYYGDEIGLPGAGDPDSRRMMKFEGLSSEEQNCLEAYRDLAQTRRRYMALMYGTTEVVSADEQTIVLKRAYFGQSVYIALNKSAQEASVVIPDERAQKARSLILGKATAEDQKILINLPPYGYEYLLIE